MAIYQPGNSLRTWKPRKGNVHYPETLCIDPSSSKPTSGDRGHRCGPSPLGPKEHQGLSKPTLLARRLTHRLPTCRLSILTPRPCNYFRCEIFSGLDRVEHRNSLSDKGGSKTSPNRSRGCKREEQTFGCFSCNKLTMFSEIAQRRQLPSFVGRHSKFNDEQPSPIWPRIRPEYHIWTLCTGVRFKFGRQILEFNVSIVAEFISGCSRHLEFSTAHSRSRGPRLASLMTTSVRASRMNDFIFNSRTILRSLAIVVHGSCNSTREPIASRFRATRVSPSSRPQS